MLFFSFFQLSHNIRVYFYFPFFLRANMVIRVHFLVSFLKGLDGFFFGCKMVLTLFHVFMCHIYFFLFIYLLIFFPFLLPFLPPFPPKKKIFPFTHSFFIFFVPFCFIPPFFPYTNTSHLGGCILY